MQHSARFCFLLCLWQITWGFQLAPYRVSRMVPRGQYFANAMRCTKEQLRSTVSTQSQDIAETSSIPRLLPNSQNLIEWVEKFGGEFKADIALDKEGWSLASQTFVPANTPLIKIPKKLCISSDVDAEPGGGSPLLSCTVKLMDSFDQSLWRARLGIALLSERARPHSFYAPYLHNLPVDFPSVPLYYTEHELWYATSQLVHHFCTRYTHPICYSP